MQTGFRRFRKKSEDDVFEEIKVSFPKSLLAILKHQSSEKHLPLSKLVCIAVDNETEIQNPFYYDTAMPTSPFVKDAYIEEAGKIFKFLDNFPNGLALDHLLLNRREMDISSKAVFMLAFRELAETGLIESFHPKRTAFKYPSTYKYWRKVKTSENTPKKSRYRKQVEETDGNY